MKFIQIKSLHDKYVDELFHLYEVSFPENQRRSVSDFKRLIKTSDKKNFYCNAIIIDQEFVGSLNYWEFDKFVYIEHFAIEESLRGNKIGKNVMMKIKLEVEKPIIFEVEHPDCEVNIRRISFYQRLEFVVVPMSYLQPSYHNDGIFIPLQLMTNNVNFIRNNFDKVKRIIYKNVYNIDKEKF